MNQEPPAGPPGLGRRLVREVLDGLKSAFVGKDEIVDILGVCLVAGENLFIMGPPGTAKSAIVHELGRRLGGNTFEYLLTRFTEPSELFGPFDIRRLREGELVTSTEGMLPEATLVFLDELLNANSAILNSLLTVLNERVFRRGRETRPLPTLMVVGASNRLPDDEALGALFDRFLARVPCPNVDPARLSEVLEAGWRLEVARDREGPPVAGPGRGKVERAPAGEHTFDIEDVRRLHAALEEVDLASVRAHLVELVLALRRAGIALSDRRAVKMQRLAAASAVLCGRTQVDPSDLWVFRTIWDTVEEQEVIAEVVRQSIGARPAHALEHPRARPDEAPDCELLAREIERIERRLTDGGATDPAVRALLADRLGVVAGRVEWVADAQAGAHVAGQVERLWRRIESSG